MRASDRSDEDWFRHHLKPLWGEGGLLDSDHYVDLAGGRFAITGPKDLQNIFATYASSAFSTLLVHFHGGLNTRAEGIQRVSQLARWIAGSFNPSFPTAITACVRFETFKALRIAVT